MQCEVIKLLSLAESGASAVLSRNLGHLLDVIRIGIPVQYQVLLERADHESPQPCVLPLPF